MSLIRYLGYLARQLGAYAMGTRQPVLVLALVVGGLVALIGIGLQLVAPVAIYPFL